MAELLVDASNLVKIYKAADLEVVALQGLEDGQAGDPEFLATVKDLATKLELGEGESKAVDVKLSTVK